MVEPEIWMEIGFDIFYLVVIWFLVAVMFKKTSQIKQNHEKAARYFRLGFFLLLAFGDSFHLGFRIMAYLTNGLEANASLVGLGALLSSITMTVLYMLTVEAWRITIKSEVDLKNNLIYWILMIASVVRLIIFIFPGNQWGSVVPPKDWSIYRNIPLIITGIGVAILMIRDGKGENEIFKKVGICIIFSFAFYLPVIFFVQEIPMLGMLMIPKTIAYMVWAWYVYKYYFK